MKGIKKAASLIKIITGPKSVPADLGVALFLSVLSTLSLLIFHYLRTCEDAVSYYTNAHKSLLLDALRIKLIWVYLLVAVALGAFYFLLRRKLRRELPAAWLFSPLLAFNMVISLSLEHSNLREIFLPGSIPALRALFNLNIFLGFAALLSSILALLYAFLDSRTKQPLGARLKANEFAKRFTEAYLIIFLCWAPVLMMCYPGSLDMNALGQIKSYMGMSRIDTANPILPSLIYGWFFKQGRIYGNDVATVFKIVMFQNVCNAGFMALVSTRCYKYTKSKLLYYITIAFFGMTAVWQRASQHLMKDVLHTGWYLAFYVSYLTCLEKDRVSVWDVLLLGFCSIMVTFTRKAVFYIAVIAIVILILVKSKQHIKKFAVCLLVLVSLFLGVEKLVYPAYPTIIKPPREVENYSMQLQQMALYCIRYGDKLTEDEKRIINETANFDTMVRNYSPMISDPVKQTWHGTEENHSEFWALYRKLMLRHPFLFLQGALMSSFEHFNPWYSGNRNGVSMAKDVSFHQIEYSNLKNLLKMVNYWNSWLDYPVSRVMYGTGLYTWILIALIGYSVKRRSRQALFGLIPDMVLMIGLFMTHVNGLLRYGYPLIATTPLLFAHTLSVVSREAAPNGQGVALKEKPKHLQIAAQAIEDSKAYLSRSSKKTKRALKKTIRDICQAVLHRLDDHKDDEQ